MPIETTIESVPGLPNTARQALARLSPPETQREVQIQLSALSTEAGLIRYSKEERAEQGVTNSAGQLQLSLACLQLLRTRPDIAKHLKATDPARFETVLGLRLSVCEARSVLRPTLIAAERAEVLLLAALTYRCDAIEDAVATRLSAGDLSPGQRRLLKGRFEDPARVQQLLEESAEARRARRGRRSAQAAEVLATRRARQARIIGREKLRKAAMPESKGGDR